MQIAMTRRKCFVCGNVSTDLDVSICKCGAYMHMVGDMFTPKVVFKQESQKDKKIAPMTLASNGAISTIIRA